MTRVLWLRRLTPAQTQAMIDLGDVERCAPGTYVTVDRYHVTTMRVLTARYGLAEGTRYRARISPAGMRWLAGHAEVEAYAEAAR